MTYGTISNWDSTDSTYETTDLMDRVQEPCTSIEDVQVISRYLAGAFAPYDQRRVTPPTRWKGVIDGGPSLYGNGLVGLRVDGSPSDGAASAPHPHTSFRTIGHGGAQGVGACEQAGAEGPEKGRQEKGGEEGRQEEACKESRAEESRAEEGDQKEGDQKEGRAKEAGTEEGRQEGRAPSEQKVREEAGEEGPSPEIVVRL